MVSFDIEAAFPSLDHSFMWEVLNKYNIPKEFINILRCLYAHHRVQMRVLGEVVEGFPVESGIKQGCPASGSLFVLCLDPFIRLLLEKIPRTKGIILAFADDLAAMLLQFEVTFPLMMRCFALLKLAAALKAHPDKTQVTPCGTETIEAMQTWIDGLLHPWNQVRVADAIHYLGVWLGQGAAPRIWEEAIAKYKVSVRSLSGMKLPWSSSAMWYGTAVQSQFTYLWSFFSPTTKIKQL